MRTLFASTLLAVTTAGLLSVHAEAQQGCAGAFHIQIQSKERLIELAQRRNPRVYTFIKDAPVFGYKITSDRFEDLPSVIRQHLGAVDQTGYSREFLAQNIGSVVALQMNGAAPDFYIIGKDTFEAKYAEVAPERVAARNNKYFSNLQGHISELLSTGDNNLVAVLKTTPVQMIRMSALGFPRNRTATIESPWGGQTRPAGRDAFLVFDESMQQYYMVNTGDNGLPLSYIRAR